MPSCLFISYSSRLFPSFCRVCLSSTRVINFPIWFFLSLHPSVQCCSIPAPLIIPFSTFVTLLSSLFLLLHIVPSLFPPLRHHIFPSFMPSFCLSFHFFIVVSLTRYFFFSCILMFFFVILSCCYCLSFLLPWPYFFFSIFVSLFDFLFLTSLIFFVLFVLYAIIAFSSLPFLCPSCSPPTSFPLTLITFPLQYLIF